MSSIDPIDGSFLCSIKIVWNRVYDGPLLMAQFASIVSSLSLTAPTGSDPDYQRMKTIVINPIDSLVEKV